MIPALKPGKRVFVSEFGDSPTDAIEHFMSLEDVAAPDPATLKPDEVIIEKHSRWQSAPFRGLLTIHH